MHADLIWLVEHEPQWAMDNQGYMIIRRKNSPCYVKNAEVDGENLYKRYPAFTKAQHQAARTLLEDPFNSLEEDEAWAEAEKRMDIIGHNGGTGEHYSEPMDDNCPAARIGELGNQAHNLGCDYQNNEDLSDELSKVAIMLWDLAKKSETSAQATDKQKRYQDTAGEDWIDEAARTFTPEEFRGAMRFSIGKYNRAWARRTI